MIAALVVAPIVIGLLLHFLPRRADATAKWIGVVVAVASLMVAAFVPAPDETLAWLTRPAFPFVASFHVGLGHGLSFWLVLLTSLTTGCALFATRAPRQRDFVAQMLILLGAMTGVFVARDLLLFALFWDLMLVPVFLIMLGWSAGHRSSAWRYFIYNVAGGLGLLAATAAYGFITGSTDVLSVPVTYANGDPIAVFQPWIFVGFAVAFLVKTPIWPLHTWMPATYSDLPSPAVAVVSAVQSKAGLYGFIAIAGLLFPHAMHAAGPLMVVLGTIGIVYGAFAALHQDDAKRVVAYSSLSHLGLILVAIFSFEPIALAGAIVYIIAHGLFSAALFIVLGAIEQREETRSLARLGGLGMRNPRLAGALAIASLAALGLPGLAGFSGEILILTGVFRSGGVWPTALALVAVVLAAAYMLRIFQGMMHGPEIDDLPQRPDLGWIEGLALAPLVLAIVLVGVDPAPLAAIGATMPTAATVPAAPATAAASHPRGVRS
ncbi:MAG: complex I subunit 4 family protein [Vulcanimicrobiaceae bacterium]